ncbi:NAD(P)H-binding protein [Dactylosporangium sp. NPDC000555]|uniref:NAD(P)-dependent oxidoreductase n=1 Tax=Dactylosporangium sp. NPDC000555 TaxID=3154260 RepID=UPI0033328D9D
MTTLATCGSPCDTWSGVTGIVVQNANAYVDGLSEPARHMIANRPGVPGAEDRVREIPTLPVTRGQYEGGTADTTPVDPSGWTLDQHFDTGHLALEENLPEIVPLIDGFPRALHRKIAVIGAGGRLGGAIAREAADRGHQVTPLGRSTMDVTDPASVTAAVAGHDAVVASLKGPDGLVPRGAAALLAGLTRAGVHRLVFVGGGGSLEYAPGQRYVDSPDFPAAYRQTAQDQAAALELLRASSGPVSWTYASPPPVHLVDGARTGRYRTEARDTPLTDAAGESRISIPDFAAAIVDTIEQRGYDRQRFTVAYA